MAKRGLPESLQMRHDQHYVDALVSSAGAPVGRMLSLDLLDPNPNQPRQLMGDLTELVASVAEKGILEPLIVRAQGARYQIIAGERRYHAAMQAGLTDVPAIIKDVDDLEVLELALIENLQRKDLTAFEEAEALAQLADRCRYTHEDMARKLGKSRTSVTEILALNAMPEEVRNLCRLADITSRSTLLHIVRQGEPAKMLALIEKLASGGATRAQARAATDEDARKPKPKAFTFNFKPATKSFSLKMTFRKSRVDKAELIETLEGIIQELKAARR